MQQPIQQRLVKGAPGSVRWSRLDADGERVAASGVVTAGIVDAAGTEVLAAGQATTEPDSDAIHVLSLSAAQVSELGLWTVTFTDAGDSHSDDVLVDVCTGRLIRISELRHIEPSLKPVQKYPTALLRDEILAAEDELEWICDRAFTRRYAREVIDGNGAQVIRLTHRDVASITSVSVNGTALTAAELAALTIHDKDLRRESGWAEGYANIIVEYVHGWLAPPTDLVRALAMRIRVEVHGDKSRIPERAERFTDETGSYDLTTPGALDTGIPKVDGVYSRYSARKAKTSTSTPGTTGIASASIPIDIDPTRDSLFHRRR